MTSKERVKKAVLFQCPDRIPFHLPEPWGSDFLWVNADPDLLFKPKIHPIRSPATDSMAGSSDVTSGLTSNGVQTDIKWEDEWGSVWEKLSSDKTMGQVKFYPLSSYENIKEYRFPDYKNPSRYLSARDAIAKNKDEKFVLAGTPLSFIHRLEYLRGHESAWTDSYLYPKEFEKLLDKLADIAIDAIDNFSKIGVDPVRSRKCLSDISVTEVPSALPTSNGVDGIISADDWGLQDRLMVSPDIWRKFWKPRYKKVYHYAHEKGLLTFLHSCGYITDIIADLIEAELDVLQLDQQENMGVEKLSKLFGGKICFWCPVDIQNTMVKGSIEDVKNYAKKLIDSFGRFNGGFMAKTYPSPEAIEHSKEKTDAMCETFVNYGSARRSFSVGG